MAKVNKNEKKLLQAALKTKHNAYVLWGFKVGAAVLTDGGRMYEGCNVESWVSGLGICAERNAINHAILHGDKKIKAIAIVMNADKRNEARPCGVCLQYIHDFAKDSKTKIVIAKAENQKILLGTVDIKTIGELLPFPYKK